MTKPKPLYVIAECVDERTNRRYVYGDVFDPAPESKQRERLFAAGCLSEDEPDAAALVRAQIGADQVPDTAAITRDQLANDGLFDKTDHELQVIATSESVDLAGATGTVDVIAKIRGKRLEATVAGVDQRNVIDPTQAAVHDPANRQATDPRLPGANKLADKTGTRATTTKAPQKK